MEELQEGLVVPSLSVQEMTPAIATDRHLLKWFPKGDWQKWKP